MFRKQASREASGVRIPHPLPNVRVRMEHPVFTFMERRMKEEWKTLIYQQKSFPDFEVSNIGRLRNLNSGIIYQQYLNRQGYFQVCVSLGSRKNRKTFRIHRAVAETFISRIKGKNTINHKDGNKKNNHADNLEWVTPQENILHAYKTRLNVPRPGTENPFAHFSEAEIRYIRKNWIARDKNFGSRALARRFNTSHTAILDIVHYRTYKNIV